MIVLILIFLMIVGPNLYTDHYGPLHVFGWTFTVGAIFFTPIVTLRDYLHEKGHNRYLIIAPIVAVIAVYLSTSPSLAAFLAVALFWSWLIDTNLYIYFRKYGVWPARIISDVITSPFTTIAYWYVRLHKFEWPDQQLLVKYITLGVVYVGILVYCRFKKDPTAC